MAPKNAEFQLNYEVLIICRLWLKSLHKEALLFYHKPKKKSYFFLKGQNAVLFISAGFLFWFLMLQDVLFGHCTPQTK